MNPVRSHKILEALSRKESASVSELSEVLGVSEVTVRSDLNALAAQGKISRTHGGARLLEERLRQEYSFETRKNINSHSKQRIGEAACMLIDAQDSVLMDSSTTVLALAHALRRRGDLKDVTVIPTGIWTAIELMGKENVNVLLPAGYVRSTSGSIAGMPTQDFFQGLIIQKAFLGAWGISPENGLTDTHLLEIELKKRIVANVKEIIVLADGSKFYQTGLASYAGVRQVRRIITDRTAPGETLKRIEKQGVEITIVH
ncbi:MAG TPA: DeoR/GlpR family DNA-binding transcription regulator [Bacteroidota bacterium]|nr:DeoR/GlpR family DNA-binding transcription regulator [Bacteroidota bacterium]